jgi:CRP/FNR family transcriptional regulator
MFNIKSFLSNTKLFSGLPPQQYQALAEIAQRQTYSKGQVIFHQGEEGRGFFIVISGRVKIYQTSLEGKEQILNFFQEGDHFAEVPAFDGGCFPVSAATVEDTELLFFPREDFITLIEVYPSLAINILAIFAKHLRKLVGLVENISLREVPQRLAAYLLDLSERQGNQITVELDLTKGQLAAVIGTIPETLSRGLTKLSHEGLIRVNGLEITLLDPEKLREKAGIFPEVS